jgi:type IV pilus biogenesis protein CpaD/CtpE
MTEQSTVSMRPIELHENRHIETLSARDMTYNHLIALSEDYNRHGDSPLYIVFGYNPDERGAHTAARNRANIVKGQLGKLDIRNAVVKSTPVVSGSDNVVIAYDRITASGPSNCGTIPGSNGVTTGSYGNYGIGCTVNDMMAQQVAYPKDLEGVAGLGERNDGLRASNIVNRDVRAGETNDFVPSYVLSELANNTTN